jgi:hypothetical protein
MGYARTMRARMPRSGPRVARAFPGSAVALAGMGLWWGVVITNNAGKDARGPDLVWRVPSLGAPAPSPARDCGGVMWVDPHPLWVAPEQEGEAGPVRIDMGHESP